jgi:hypothetical protein
VGDDSDIAKVHSCSSGSDKWLERDLAGKPGPTFPDHAHKPEMRQGDGLDPGPKKETRPKGPGAPYALRRNIFRKRQKTMVCLAFG